MNQSQDAYPYIELEFAHETIKRHLATHPNSASDIALQLLVKLREQKQKEFELEQKYNELLTSYFNVNDAYLATLKLLKERNS